MPSPIADYPPQACEAFSDSEPVRASPCLMCPVYITATDMIVASNSPAVSVTNRRSKASSASTRITIPTSFLEGPPRAEIRLLR